VGDDTDRGDDELVRDEDDHDEISLAEAALRGSPTAEQRAVLQARLSALTDALARNTRQAHANPGEQGFLNYEPPPAGQAGTAAEGRSRPN